MQGGAGTAIYEKLKKMEILFDQEEFVVIDNGTGFVKAGFSGQDLPRIIIPTCVGEHVEPIDPTTNPTSTQADQQEEKKTTYAFGYAALQAKETHDIIEPIERGIIQNWDYMEQIWLHIFDELNLDPKNVNVLMTDSPFNPKEKRCKMADIMFETFKVKSLAVMNTAALSMYSTGKVSGLIVECGEGISYTVPVFEGYALPHARIKLEVAGQDITHQLIQSLHESGIDVRSHPEVIRGLKEQMCSVSQNFNFDMQNPDDPLNQEERSYELPNGDIIEVDHKKRFAATEILFNPQLMPNIESKEDRIRPLEGIAQMAYSSIEKCDNDLKINLYNNIVLAGGSTLMPGFKERFEMEICQKAENSAKTDINVFADLYRKNAAWIGGSMLASFSTFRDMTITKEDYENSQQEPDKSTAILRKSIN